MLLLSRSLCRAAVNVREVLCRPRRVQTEPVLTAEHPWEANGVYLQGSVLREDDGRYRMWYSAIGAQRREQQYACVAESADGLHWTKPLARARAHGEWAQTNIVYGQRFNISAPFVGRYQEPRDGYRYFMAFDSRIEQHEQQAVPRVGGLTEADRRRLMRHPSYTPGLDWNKYFLSSPPTWRATYLADSRDGLTWEPTDGRYAIAGQADGDHPVVYDPIRQCYRMYLRTNRVDENGQRIRQVITATSRDTIEWTHPELCLESDAIDDPRVRQIHGMIVTHHAGLYIGVIQMMEIIEEVPGWNPLMPFERARFHGQLAVSVDGVHFTRVAERAEYLGTGAEGTFDAGMVRPGSMWIVEDERMRMYYDGRPYAHAPKEGKAAGLSPQVGIGVVESPRDRFAGLTPTDATQPGEVLIDIPAGTRQVTLNAAIGADASVRVGVHQADSSRVLTHTAEGCTPVRGDGLRLPVRWGELDMLPSQGAQLRLTLLGPATVYAVDFA